jgi:hypothetical protein
MGAAAATILVVIFLIALVGYLVVRARQPTPPPHEREGGTDTMWDSDGAVPRDPGGMPLSRPPEDPT